MKIAPIARALDAYGTLRYQIVHTGQHYDREMNGVFFEELGIPEPAVFMAAGGGSHSEQTGKIMLAFDKYCQTQRPDAVVVVGDVNSTLACTIAAKKLGIPVGHVEAGLRSGDMTMPEEINRLATDSISDWFFATEPSAVRNLKREGKPDAAVHHVGHVMIDNLLYQLKKLEKTSVSGPGDLKKRATANGGRYAVATLHRPGNVDNAVTLAQIGEALREIAIEVPIIFPVHPRTRDSMTAAGIDLGPNVALVGPQPYMSFLELWKDAAVVLTDSGGLQDETTALDVPCITLRENTERPVTVEEGSNVLAGTDPDRIVEEARRVLRGEAKRGTRPALWDGKAAERIVEILARELE